VSHLEVLDSELRKFRIDLPASKKSLLARYCDELARWNKRINLTGLSGVDMVRRLVVEPVWIGLQLKPEGILADIGSGNGSPAIPLHVTCAFRKAHLVESRTRRAAFLRHLTTTLPLSDIAVHHERFEAIVSELDTSDWITLQGVALNSRLMDSIKQISLSTTNIVWITSPSARSELSPIETLRVPFTGTEVLVFRPRMVRP
jgi:16S rRNA (guanine(527)-N(7))-methyltransferase RsmG